jgi:hypothetical protein
MTNQSGFLCQWLVHSNYSGCQVQGSQFTVGRIQGDIGFTLDFRVKLPGVSQEPDELRIRLGIEPLFYQFNLEP